MSQKKYDGQPCVRCGRGESDQADHGYYTPDPSKRKKEFVVSAPFGGAPKAEPKTKRLLAEGTKLFAELSDLPAVENLAEGLQLMATLRDVKHERQLCVILAPNEPDKTRALLDAITMHVNAIGNHLEQLSPEFRVKLQKFAVDVILRKHGFDS